MTQKTDTIKFLKFREVKSPNRAFPSDAGIDFFIPKFDKRFIEDLKEKNPHFFAQYLKLPNDSTIITNVTSYVSLEGSSAGSSMGCQSCNYFGFDEDKGKAYFILPPQSRITIPSGISSRMAEAGRALVAANKSGIASKHGIIFGAQVIDYTYKGEIHISIINTSNEGVCIYEDMKIIQFLEIPVFNSEVKIVEGENNFEKFYEGLTDDRGVRGFGSTDKK